MSYSIRFQGIAATTELEAITKAVGMLRTGVRLNGVNRVTEHGGLWTVSLNVFEDL